LVVGWLLVVVVVVVVVVYLVPNKPFCAHLSPLFLTRSFSHHPYRQGGGATFRARTFQDNSKEVLGKAKALSLKEAAAQFLSGSSEEYAGRACGVASGAAAARAERKEATTTRRVSARVDHGKSAVRRTSNELATLAAAIVFRQTLTTVGTRSLSSAGGCQSRIRGRSG